MHISYVPTQYQGLISIWIGTFGWYINHVAKTLNLELIRYLYTGTDFD